MLGREKILRKIGIKTPVVGFLQPAGEKGHQCDNNTRFSAGFHGILAAELAWNSLSSSFVVHESKMALYSIIYCIHSAFGVSFENRFSQDDG